MRITVHIPDALAEEAKRMASNEKTSVSSFTSQALDFYINEKRKKALGQKVLALAGNIPITNDVNKELDEGRDDDAHRH